MNNETKTILITDDNADYVHSTKILLEMEGYRVITAKDGASGFELAKAEKPDLMILDVMMTTDTEGFEISRAIAETPDLKNMPVIMVTGIRGEMNLPFAFEPDEQWLPVGALLEKPVDPQKLLAEIRRLLDKAQ